MKTTLLIDGDLIAYVTAARNETKIDWGDGEVSRYVKFDDVRNDAEAWIADIQDRLKADNVVICLGDPERRYFRHDIWPDYKANRTHGETPLALFEMREQLRQHPKAKWKPRIEADDVMGILATHPTLIPGRKIIVTTDKDLGQIPGLHYNPQRDSLVELGDWEAEAFFWQQCLTGDPTDGIPGCPRIGAVRAERILAEAMEACAEAVKEGKDYRKHERRFIWSAIVAAYGARGLDEDYALKMARCVRILQHTDWDFAKKKVKLWRP